MTSSFINTRQTAAKTGGVAANLLRSTICHSPKFMTALWTTDIRPILDFGSPVWCTNYVDLKLLEMVQRRWSKQVHGLTDLPYTDRLRMFDLFSAKGQLLRQDLLYCYRIFNGLWPIKPEDLFTFPTHNIGTGGHRYKI